MFFSFSNKIIPFIAVGASSHIQHTVPGNVYNSVRLVKKIQEPIAQVVHILCLSTLVFATQFTLFLVNPSYTKSVRFQPAPVTILFDIPLLGLKTF